MSDAVERAKAVIADEFAPHGPKELLRDLVAEVGRLTAGIEKALANPDARAYILEHTLENGADNCCEGRCQGHGTAEAVRG